MDETRFWEIIEISRERALVVKRNSSQDFIDVHEKTLADELRKLPPDEIIAFNDKFWELHRKAYDWGLWAVAYWLDGGCSDDGFTDFRSTLVSLGKEKYYQSITDPDSLADIVDLPDAPYMQSEGFQYVASKVYEELNGGASFPYTPSSPGPLPEPTGERFDFDDDDEMARRFPRTVAKFPEGMD